jgi:hypothetical protein
VYYSPFGHPGNFFEDNNGFADFIVKDYSNGVRDFDMDSWRDVTGLPFKGSLNVAWYSRKAALGVRCRTVRSSTQSAQPHETYGNPGMWKIPSPAFLSEF